MRDIWKRIVWDIKNYYISIIFFLLLYIVVKKIFHAFCPFLIVTGFPCAGCGMTRAVLCILTGQFARANNLNPAAFFWIAWAIYFCINRYILGKKGKWNKCFLGTVCVITLGIYLYRMYTQFPGNPPMTYYRNNFLSKYWTLFDELLQYIIQIC